MALESERRRCEIAKTVKDNGKARVLDLSNQFGVSEVTIRKDLELLETQGVLTRVHGGAVSVNGVFGSINLNEKYRVNVEAKQALAEKVAELVEDNDTIMMNAGTTLTYVVRALQDKKNISVVTNSIQIASEISTQTTFNVVLLGGQIDYRDQVTFGTDSIRQLENYHASKCIVSFGGVTPSYGLSLYFDNEALTIQKMMERSDTVIVAADKSKIGKNAFHKIAPVTEMDILVTNRSEGNETLDELRRLGIQVVES